MLFISGQAIPVLGFIVDLNIQKSIFSHGDGLQQHADKIGVSKSQYIRYETKDVQPPANIMNKLADMLGTAVDYLISGDKTEKAKASLKNSELIQRFKEVDALPEEEQGVLIKIISAYVRDYKTKQAYAS
ncbi:helix-turn-helix transcriptional regulator [Paraflavitalea speifideaquila]|uniref:helix-turn-helix domain-containing protein n=1 Tax=Paraflavitalea speifideaquila TaxID=3076558 RepID=UPI0028E549D8|nr:helix-turn-helix transcriptional regulator [Paraflavitalea speifideiaquila]